MAVVTWPFTVPESTTIERLADFMPSEPNACSLMAKGSTLIVRRYCLPPAGEAILPSVHDPCITVHLSPRACPVERSLGDSFLKAVFSFNSLSFIPPNHSSCWRWSAPADVLHMHISHEFIEKYAEQGASLDLKQLENVHWFGVHDAIISQIGLTCVTQIEASRARIDPLYIDLLAVILLGRLFDRHTEQPSENLKERSQININGIKTALDYIVDNFRDDVRLENLAEVANVSLYHFIRQFRAVTGVTPHQYLLKCRIETAKALLRDGSKPVIEVGERSGFSSHSHFTHTFSRLVGMTPTAYRQ